MKLFLVRPAVSVFADSITGLKGSHVYTSLLHICVHLMHKNILTTRRPSAASEINADIVFFQKKVSSRVKKKSIIIFIPLMETGCHCHSL